MKAFEALQNVKDPLVAARAKSSLPMLQKHSKKP